MADKTLIVGEFQGDKYRNPDGTLKKPRRKPLVDPTRSRVTGRAYKKKAKRSSRSNAARQSVGTGTDDNTAQAATTSTPVVEKWELYRKISYAIITQDGSYELPPDWDDTDTSPTWSGGLPDPVDPWFRQERVHEIGYIDSDKRIYKEKMYVPLLDRPGESGSFGATLEMVINDGSNGHVPGANRIPGSLLGSSEAQGAIADAGLEL